MQMKFHILVKWTSVDALRLKIGSLSMASLIWDFQDHTSLGPSETQALRSKVKDLIQLCATQFGAHGSKNRLSSV